MLNKKKSHRNTNTKNENSPLSKKTKIKKEKGSWKH